jgi:hypothetical protein
LLLFLSLLLNFRDLFLGNLSINSDGTCKLLINNALALTGVVKKVEDRYCMKLDRKLYFDVAHGELVIDGAPESERKLFIRQSAAEKDRKS